MLVSTCISNNILTTQFPLLGKKKMKFPLADLKTSAKVTFKIAFPGMPSALRPGVSPFVSMSFSASKLWCVHSGPSLSATCKLQVTVMPLSPNKKQKQPFTQLSIIFLERMTDHSLLFSSEYLKAYSHWHILFC